MSSVKIYFILYIVLLCEMFIVLLDRDRAIEEIKRENLPGKGLNFAIDIPNNNLSITIFSTSTGQYSAKSDIAKTVILGKTFLTDDIIVKDTSMWEELPNKSKIDIAYISQKIIDPPKKDFIHGNYIFSISYNGPKLSAGDQDAFTSGKIKVEFHLWRLITPEIRKELEKSKRTELTKTINEKEYIFCKVSNTIGITFNKSYFQVKCPPCN